MALLDMITHAVGPAALQQIGARVGLSPDQLQNVVGSLMPLLAPKIAEHAETGTLEQQAPNAANPPPPGTQEATDHGNNILASILGSKDKSREVANDASAQTGISADKIKAALPQIAGIAAAAILAHKASQAGGGGLGGLFKSFGADLAGRS